MAALGCSVETIADRAALSTTTQSSSSCCVGIAPWPACPISNGRAVVLTGRGSLNLRMLAPASCCTTSVVPAATWGATDTAPTAGPSSGVDVRSPTTGASGSDVRQGAAGAGGWTESNIIGTFVRRVLGDR